MPCFLLQFNQYMMHYIHVQKKPLKFFYVHVSLLLRKRPCLSLNQIETQTVVCSILPVECNVCLVKCSVYPVESSIDVDHVKFPLGLILATILTPKVENEVFDKDKNEVLTGTK